MNELELEFNRYKDDAPVKCVIEYNFVQDFDFVPCGESMVKRDTSFIEIKRTTYSINGEKYEPTDYERKHWEKDMQAEIADAIGRAA